MTTQAPFPAGPARWASVLASPGSPSGLTLRGSSLLPTRGEGPTNRRKEGCH